MIRRPPRSTQSRSSAASDVYKRQVLVLPAASVQRFRKRGIALEVLTALHVLAVTANPFRAPQPYQPKIFFDAVAGAVGDRVPVFDVVNGRASLPGEARRPDVVSP